MEADKEGFLYPKVDNDICVDCGLCVKVCNVLHPYVKREPLKVLAAINKNEYIRLRSSSGGIFYTLAEKTVNEGGVVFGARFDENWQVIIDHAEDMNGIKVFMGSKYVQARIENAYIDTKRFLQVGRKVLFSGTPCQVAGLYKYLGKQYSNLLTVDFVCHGVPSPMVWEMYLKEVCESMSIKKISFRDKERGWERLHFSVEYAEKSTSLLSSASENQFMKAFLSDLILRPSCSSCVAKSCRSQSDITMADFWGIWNINPEMNDDKGTSMLLINTQKGLDALPDESLVKYFDSDYETARKYNSACESSVRPNPKREEFFSQLQNTRSVTRLIDRTLQASFLKRNLKALKIFIIRLVDYVINMEWGGKKNYDSHYYTMPYIDLVSFRNKSVGWRDYRLEIIIKDKQ